jgi:hypothetical protein
MAVCTGHFDPVLIRYRDQGAGVNCRGGRHLSVREAVIWQRRYFLSKIIPNGWTWFAKRLAFRGQERGVVSFANCLAS